MPLIFRSLGRGGSSSGGGGDVTGPASAVDDRIATFDGVTGKIIQDGGQTIAEVIAAASGGLKRTIDVTLTDAEIKALPTTGGGVRVLATPASGKILSLASVQVIAKINGLAYSNVAASSTGYLALGGGEPLLDLDVSGQIFKADGYGFFKILGQADVSSNSSINALALIRPAIQGSTAVAANNPFILLSSNQFTDGVNAVSRAGTAAAGTADLGNFTSEQSTNSGAGTGAIFHITKAGGVYTVTPVTPGNGFAALDTLTFDGALLGGLTIVNDLVVTVDSVQTVTQDFTGGGAGNYLRLIIEAYELTF